MIATLLVTLCVSATRLAPVAQHVSTLSTDNAQDVTGDGVAFVEIFAERTTCYVHEPIRLGVRFGIDEEYLRARMVALFQQTMDVPVQVTAPWWQGSAPLTVLDTPTANDGPPMASFALGDSIERARKLDDRVENGHRFQVFEIERTFVATQSGTIPLAEPILRFAFATRFEDDFLKGRVPLDRRDAFVRGKALAITITPLPEEHRPAGFTGAVGVFRVQAELTRRDSNEQARTIEVGESFQLALRVSGRGNFAHFGAPQLDALPGFEVKGMLDDVVPMTQRTFVYDLVATSERVREVPAIPFAFFDPDPPAGYRVVRTEPIPIHVRASDVDARANVVKERRRWPWWLASAAVATGLVIAGLLRRRALRPLDATAAEARRVADIVRASADAAVRASEANAAHADVSRARAQITEDFTSYLGTRLRCSPAAVIGPKLAERLVSIGAPDALAARTSTLFDALVAERFGGEPPWNAAHQVRAIVDELEAAFTKPARGR